MKKYKHLSEEQIDKFVEVQAITKSPQTAMIAAQPELITNKPYANNKGHSVLKRTDIQDKLQKKLESISKKSIKRIEELVQSDDESIATQNSWKVIEHVRGKPITKSVNLHAQANIEDALFTD